MGEKWQSVGPDIHGEGGKCTERVGSKRLGTREHTRFA